MKNRIKLIYSLSLASLIFLGIMFTSCDGLKGAGGFGDMLALRDTLSTQLKTDHINVNINNGNYLTVSVINSAYNDSSGEVQKSLALQIGEKAYRIVGKKNHIIAGSVIYVADKSFLIFHSNSSRHFGMELSRFVDSDSINRKGI